MAIAAAFLAGEHDRVEALARDHLLDHPSRPVLAWIVAHSRSATRMPEALPERLCGLADTEGGTATVDEHDEPVGDGNA